MMAGFDREGIADMMFVQGRAELRDRVAFLVLPATTCAGDEFAT